VASSVDVVNLKDRLGEIKTNARNIHGGAPGRVWVTPLMLTAASAGVVHAIKCAVQRARYMTLETIAPLNPDCGPSSSLITCATGYILADHCYGSAITGQIQE
jgi:hypothetical protein